MQASMYVDGSVLSPSAVRQWQLDGNYEYVKEFSRRDPKVTLCEGMVSLHL